MVLLQSKVKYASRKLLLTVGQFNSYSSQSSRITQLITVINKWAIYPNYTIKINTQND